MTKKQINDGKVYIFYGVCRKCNRAVSVCGKLNKIGDCWFCENRHARSNNDN